MIVENKVRWRKLALALFVISMLGPWAFDLLNVPAQYPCDKPTVRLSGDFCGYPLSGFEALIMAASGFIHLLKELLNGNIAGRIPELFAPLYAWIIILPFFCMLLLLWNKNSHQLQIINLIAWGLAGLSALTMFILQASREQVVHFFYLLWGIWLYALVAIGTAVFEILVLRSNTKR